MKDESTPQAEPSVKCTVLITPTTVGEIICAAGAILTLPLSEAKTLEELGKVRIDGI